MEDDIMEKVDKKKQTKNNAKLIKVGGRKRWVLTAPEREKVSRSIRRRRQGTYPLDGKRPSRKDNDSGEEVDDES